MWLKSDLEEVINLEGVFLSSISEATGVEHYAIETSHLEFVNDNGNLHLRNKDTGTTYKTSLNMERHFQRVLEENRSFQEEYLTAGHWKDTFREIPVATYFEEVSWVGLHPAFELLRLIKEKEEAKFSL